MAHRRALQARVPGRAADGLRPRDAGDPRLVRRAPRGRDRGARAGAHAHRRGRRRRARRGRLPRVRPAATATGPQHDGAAVRRRRPARPRGPSSRRCRGRRGRRLAARDRRAVPGDRARPRRSRPRAGASGHDGARRSPMPRRGGSPSTRPSSVPRPPGSRRCATSGDRVDAAEYERATALEARLVAGRLRGRRAGGRIAGGASDERRTRLAGTVVERARPRPRRRRGQPTPTLRASVRRRRIWIGFAALLVLGAIVLFVVQGAVSAGGPRLGADNPAPTGAKALVQVLARSRRRPSPTPGRSTRRSTAPRPAQPSSLYDEFGAARRRPARRGSPTPPTGSS